MNEEILYHYCSSDAFYSIISSNKIRITSLFHSNDRFETSWSTNLIINFAKKCLDDKEKPLSLQKFLENEFSNELFAFCMSKERDMLSQWRAYADDGRGFSIGLSKNFIKKLCKYNKIVPMELVDVLYNREIQEEISKKIALSWPIIISILNNKNGNIAIKSNKLLLDEWLMHLSVTKLFKHPSFSEEKEVRIRAINPIDKFEDIFIDRNNVGFICKNDKIIPYYELVIGQDSPYESNYEMKSSIDISPIRSIHIGPKNKTTTATLRTFLALNNYHGISLSNSECTYR